MACYRSVERQRAAGPGAGRGASGVCGESQLVLVKTGKGHRSELNDLVAVAQCQMFHFVPVEFGSLITGELRPRETTAVAFCAPERYNVPLKCPEKRSEK